MFRSRRGWPHTAEEGRMAHQIAKLLLEHAGTFLEREEAVRSALSLGMPLNEIEAYLDWIDSLRPSASLGSPKGEVDNPPSVSKPASSSS